MLSLPRVAVGTVQPDADSRAILWALMESFREQGLQVQSFLSQASFARYHGTATATGLNPRHLDSWLMPCQVCRELFVRGAENSDLALVHGRFADRVVDENPAAENDGAGGSLDALCRWLDLPRLAVLDVSRLDETGLPSRPPRVDGVLLDCVIDRRHLTRLTARLQSHWGVPVLGALAVLPELRAEVDAVPTGDRPPRELCQQLGSHFSRHSRPESVVELAFRRGVTGWQRSNGCGADPAAGQLTVALGYDEALNCYFPDSLDMLEARGAKILDFSLLRDERLPEGTDVVYLGCGHPERYAAELSQNYCMKLALRDHLRQGGRIYAEGGGLAYLCQQIETAEGDLWRMAGVFPAIARLDPSASEPRPVEVTLGRDTWLGPQGTRLRGYRNSAWRLEPTGALAGCVAEADGRFDLVQSCQAIGSQIHLNFAAQVDLLTGFFRSSRLPAELADPWTIRR